MGGQIVDLAQQRCRSLLVRHGQHREVLQHLLAAALLVVAIVSGSAVQDDARDVRTAVGILEDALGVSVAGVVAWVAADEGNLAVGYVGDVGEVCVEEVALDLSRALARVTWHDISSVTDCSLRRLPRQWDQLCNLRLVGIRTPQRKRALEACTGGRAVGR
jgi:hypothetical protein